MGDAVGPVAFSSLICRWEWLETDEAKKFSNAYRASREWVNTSDPEEIARAESSFFPDHSAEAVAQAIRTYQQMGTWSGDIAIPKNLYENALNVFEHSRLISQRYPYEKVVVPPP
ncbi:MAG: hypothetical protein BA865_06325 [Desulfobacterales bacterium S5133MH4]|nr:MAG: hypothetical protein BA865_06325 [Desulfobacterales bacterium S5133MH4]